MKIIIISPSVKIIGGVERFSQLLFSGLSQKGLSIEIVGVESLGFLSTNLISLSKILGLKPIVLGFFLGRKAKSKNPDIYITNGLLGWSIQNKKIINVQHGTYACSAERVDKKKSFVKFFIKRYVWGFFEKKASQHSSVCVAVSEETKLSVQKFYKRDRVIVIPNGVDTEFFKPNSSVVKKTKQGIFVGRFEYAKGDFVLEDIKNYLHQNGGELIIAEKFNQNKLLQAYNESSFFVLPSLHEGCSFALLEAMSCGLPVFVSNVGSAAVDNFPFKTYSFHKMKSMINDIQVFMNLNQTEKKRLSQKSRDYVLQNHDIDSCIKHYYQVIITL